MEIAIAHKTGPSELFWLVKFIIGRRKIGLKAGWYLLELNLNRKVLCGARIQMFGPQQYMYGQAHCGNRFE